MTDRLMNARDFFMDVAANDLGRKIASEVAEKLPHWSIISDEEADHFARQMQNYRNLTPR